MNYHVENWRVTKIKRNETLKGLNDIKQKCKLNMAHNTQTCQRRSHMHNCPLCSAVKVSVCLSDIYHCICTIYFIDFAVVLGVMKFVILVAVSLSNIIIIY